MLCRFHTMEPVVPGVLLISECHMSTSNSSIDTHYTTYASTLTHTKMYHTYTCIHTHTYTWHTHTHPHPHPHTHTHTHTHPHTHPHTHTHPHPHTPTPTHTHTHQQTHPCTHTSTHTHTHTNTHAHNPGNHSGKVGLITLAPTDPTQCPQEHLVQVDPSRYFHLNGLLSVVLDHFPCSSQCSYWKPQMCIQYCI